MFDIQNYASFLVAIIVFQAVPGAGTLAILNATARDGVRAGFAAVCGTLTGDFLFMLTASAGLASALQANPLLFQVLQWFGAAYLAWLGAQLLRAPSPSDTKPIVSKQSAGRYFRQACAVSLTNPKVVLFFVAFFPLFLRPGAPATTLLAMMAHVTLIGFLYQAALVLVGNAVAQRLRGVRGARLFATRLAGVAMMALAIRLALANG